MDIFSCKNFDHEKAIAYIRDAFDVKEMDRMLVQRGLSFRGPHHGKHGATDELIAAAQARIEAGIISKEPALPDESPVVMATEREAALARHAEATRPQGHMVWPQYGLTPDVGTYGETVEAPSDVEAATADCEPCARNGAKVIALGQDQASLLGADGRPLAASEPVQVNPTASISGLLDKLSHTGRQGRAFGRALAEWERLARDPDATIALALSTPLIADGLREVLVYAVERHYVDTVVLSADDLFADLYEALGSVHFDDGVEMIATAEGRERTLAFFAEFLASDEMREVSCGSELWRTLGATLATRAPRKGVLQAAEAASVALFTPDLATSAFATALLAARAGRLTVPLDPAEDLLALAQLLAERPRLGVIRTGETAVDTLLLQAREVLPALGRTAPMLVGSVSLGAAPLGSSDHAVSVAADAGFALPLLATGLAQRFRGARQRRIWARKFAREEQAALA